MSINKINELNNAISMNTDTTDQQKTLTKILITKGGRGSKWNEYECILCEKMIVEKPDERKFDYEYLFWNEKEIRKGDNSRMFLRFMEEIKKIINKRNTLKNIPINSKFNGSERHHIDKEHIIYIPKKLHHSVYHNIWNGKGMEEINKLAWDSLKEIE